MEGIFPARNPLQKEHRLLHQRALSLSLLSRKKSKTNHNPRGISFNFLHAGIKPEESSRPATMAELRGKTADCSQGFCSVYCPQWCFIVQPSPPSFTPQESISSTEFSPFFIAIIGVLTSALLLLLYYALFSRYFNRSEIPGTRRVNVAVNWWYSPSDGGLEESLIKSIRVVKFSVEEKVECSDCSICLGEFQGEDFLRVLPNCNHPFHVSCVDVWLRSNSTCPLCRSRVVSAGELLKEEGEEGAGEELRSYRDEEGKRVEVITRSFSLMEEGRIMRGLGAGGESSCGGDMAEQPMKRSYSCGRFGFSGHGRWSHNVLPF